MMASNSKITLLTGPNYNEWALEAKAHLRGLGLWGVTSGVTYYPANETSRSVRIQVR